MQTKYALHWFRRDLRLEGNPALARASAACDGRVLGIFCFDQKFLARPDFSPNRFQFFLQTLLKLREQMRALGGDLLVMDVGPDVAFGTLFESLKGAGIPLPSLVTFNRDYEPFARERDQRMGTWFQSQEVGVETFRDHLILEPHEVLKDDGTFYQVFTPYKRKWLDVFKRVRDRAEVGQIAKLGLTWRALLGEKLSSQVLTEDLLLKYLAENEKRVTIEIPEAGHEAARRAVFEFTEKEADYEAARDVPSKEGTSRLSHFFKNGSITTAQVVALLGLDRKPDSKYLSELIWREFYYAILFHVPRVEREAFLTKYNDLKWENNEAHFKAWREGLTGFPIVDAGMRELKATGFMHNRVRMIVASFLTKDLLISWRWGERHFMRELLDGDLAPNNGGWQWAASTGVDPQPYFRIFNPTLQGERFDPEETYIRRWVPEFGTAAYPEPIVDHKVQSKRALALYAGPAAVMAQGLKQESE